MSDESEESGARPPRTLDPALRDVLVCPVTRGPLRFDAAAGELISDSAGLAYPVRDGVPIMLPERARRLDDDAGDRPSCDRGAADAQDAPPR